LPSEEAEAAVAAEEVAVLQGLHPQDLPLHVEEAHFPDAVLP